MSAAVDWLSTDCARCDGERATRLMESGDVLGALTIRMIVCPDCGSKRCPKAAWHGADCSAVTLRTPSEVALSVNDPIETLNVPDSTGSMTTGSDR